MTALKYVKPERVPLLNHPELRERWVQERIAEDPSILGLGELILKDKERMQPRAGRLDLLLENEDRDSRFEVEVQLGSTDESHIIRTIEYWDIERKRYPQYDHYAVIVAEDITSRFLNVINLFNGHIPLIAIQMRAFRMDEQVSLMFTTVMDYMPPGVPEDQEGIQAAATREYWEERATQKTVGLADRLFGLVKRLDPHLELNYTKFYIGIARDGVANNFLTFRPQKNALLLEIRLPLTPTTDKLIDDTGMERLEYSTKWGKYRLRITDADLKHQDMLAALFKQAYTGENEPLRQQAYTSDGKLAVSGVPAQMATVNG